MRLGGQGGVVFEASNLIFVGDGHSLLLREEVRCWDHWGWSLSGGCSSLWPYNVWPLVYSLGNFSSKYGSRVQMVKCTVCTSCRALAPLSSCSHMSPYQWLVSWREQTSLGLYLNSPAGWKNCPASTVEHLLCWTQQILLVDCL